jgi:hypothetical protein
MAVLAETTVQVLVGDTVTLPLPAAKIDEIVASIKDVNCFVIDNKVIFQGILHKQIFFVDLNGIVRHVGVDISFSGIADTPGVPAGSSCQITPIIVFINFNLLSATELRETVVIDVGVIVTDMSSNALIFTNTLPPVSQRFGSPNTVSTKGGFGIVQ